MYGFVITGGIRQVINMYKKMVMVKSIWVFIAAIL